MMLALDVVRLVNPGFENFKDFKERGQNTLEVLNGPPISDRIAMPGTQPFAHPMRQIDKFLAVPDV